MRQSGDGRSAIEDEVEGDVDGVFFVKCMDINTHLPTSLTLALSLSSLSYSLLHCFFINSLSPCFTPFQLLFYSCPVSEAVFRLGSFI